MKRINNNLLNSIVIVYSTFIFIFIIFVKQIKLFCNSSFVMYYSEKFVTLKFLPVGQSGPVHPSHKYSKGVKDGQNFKFDN